MGDFLEKLTAGALSILLMEAGSSGSDGFDIMTSEVIKKSTVCVREREYMHVCARMHMCVYTWDNLSDQVLSCNVDFWA